LYFQSTVKQNLILCQNQIIFAAYQTLHVSTQQGYYRAITIKNLVIKFPEGRRLKRDVGNLPPCSADVKNEWSYTSAPYLPPWCGQGKFTFNFFITTCYFRSKHADLAVENKETIIEDVFDWQEHIGHHAASVIRCTCLWVIGHRKPQDTVSI